MEFPEPVISIAIEPKTKADQERLGGSLQKLRSRRPVVPRLDRPRDRADAHLRDGRAAPGDHRRPPAARVQGRRQRRQAAGRVPGDDAQVGRARDEIHPADRRPRPVRACRPARRADGARAAATSSSTAPRAASSRASTSPRSRRASSEAMESGVLAGYPVVDVKATVTDGSYHEVDSSEMAFKIAGSMAFKEAMAKASPVLLEPIMARRGGHARRLHGGRHRRHQPAPRSHQRAGAARQHAGDHRQGRRSPRCSGTRRICDRARRAARLTRCSSRITSRYRKGLGPRCRASRGAAA